MAIYVTQPTEAGTFTRRFVEALQELFNSHSSDVIVDYSVDWENNIHLADTLPELRVSFTAQMSHESISKFMWMLHPPVDVDAEDDERLDAIAREFPDTLYLKEL